MTIEARNLALASSCSPDTKKPASLRAGFALGGTPLGRLGLDRVQPSFQQRARRGGCRVDPALKTKILNPREKVGRHAKDAALAEALGWSSLLFHHCASSVTHCSWELGRP